jgi:hypothetical protein
VPAAERRQGMRVPLTFWKIIRMGGEFQTEERWFHAHAAG